MVSINEKTTYNGPNQWFVLGLIALIIAFSGFCIWMMSDGTKIIQDQGNNLKSKEPGGETDQPTPSQDATWVDPETGIAYTIPNGNLTPGMDPKQIQPLSDGLIKELQENKTLGRFIYDRELILDSFEFGKGEYVIFADDLLWEMCDFNLNKDHSDADEKSAGMTEARFQILQHQAKSKELSFLIMPTCIIQKKDLEESIKTLEKEGDNQTSVLLPFTTSHPGLKKKAAQKLNAKYGLSEQDGNAITDQQICVPVFSNATLYCNGQEVGITENQQPVFKLRGKASDLKKSLSLSNINLDLSIKYYIAGHFFVKDLFATTIKEHMGIQQIKDYFKEKRTQFESKEEAGKLGLAFSMDLGVFALGTNDAGITTNQTSIIGDWIEEKNLNEYVQAWQVAIQQISVNEFPSDSIEPNHDWRSELGFDCIDVKVDLNDNSELLNANTEQLALFNAYCRSLAGINPANPARIQEVERADIPKIPGTDAPAGIFNLGEKGSVAFSQIVQKYKSSLRFYKLDEAKLKKFISDYVTKIEKRAGAYPWTANAVLLLCVDPARYVQDNISVDLSKSQFITGIDNADVPSSFHVVTPAYLGKDINKDPGDNDDYLYKFCLGKTTTFAITLSPTLQGDNNVHLGIHCTMKGGSGVEYAWEKDFCEVVENRKVVGVGVLKATPTATDPYNKNIEKITYYADKKSEYGYNNMHEGERSPFNGKGQEAKTNTPAYELNPVAKTSIGNLSAGKFICEGEHHIEYTTERKHWWLPGKDTHNRCCNLALVSLELPSNVVIPYVYESMPATERLIPLGTGVIEKNIIYLNPDTQDWEVITKEEYEKRIGFNKK